MRRTAAALAMIGIAVVAIGIAMLSGTVAATASVDPDVTVRCPGSLSVEACADWGDRVLADGPPSTTFEMQDLVRIELSRGVLGAGSTCQAAYFIGRYPDEAVWDEEVACPAG